MKILFVCTGNTCRSPMAEAVFRQLLEREGMEGVYVSSAGIFAFESQPASENAVAVTESRGIDLKGHKARRMTKKQIDEYDLILTMTESHREVIMGITADSQKVHTLNGYIGKRGEIVDPFGHSVEVYEQTILDMSDSLELLLEKIKRK